MTRLEALLLEALDIAHSALRAVDAADLSSPLPLKATDEVSDAVQIVETIVRGAGFKLSESR